MAIFENKHKCWEDAFNEALGSIGGVCPKDIEADGKIHRFSFNGRNGNDSGWYIIFADEMTGGTIGSWGTGEKINWYYAPGGREWTPDQISALHKKSEERFRQAEIERKEKQANAAITANERWNELTVPEADHPYLVAKGIKAHGIRMGKGRLYIPMHDETGHIVSLQSIDDKGKKLFMKDGRVKGCYFILGTPRTRLLIAEGYATAASIYEASGEAVAVVFDSGNMLSAIKSLKQRFPALSFKVCADNDAGKDVNIGLQFAENVHAELGIDYIFPEFGGKEGSDFNDYAKTFGFPALQAIFMDKSNQKKNKFVPLSFSELMNMPRPEWVIEGIFTTQSFGVIYGKPESCKTFVAIDMALCVAHGMQWHGRDVIQGSVLYVVGEGMGGLSKRLKAWQHEYCRDRAIPPFYAITSNVNFRDPLDVAELMASIDGLAQKFSLIIIDTVARAMTGGEENDSVDMGLFVAGCDQIKEHAKCAVIGIHHSGKDEVKGMRGSTALLGAVDTVIYSEQPEQGTVILQNQKQKDGEHFADLTFQTVQIATGLRETSLIIETTEDKPKDQKKVNGRLERAMQFLWDCIATDNRKILGCPATTIDKWKAACADRELAGDTPAAKRMAFNRTMEKLQSANKIACGNGMVWVLENGGSNG